MDFDNEDQVAELIATLADMPQEKRAVYLKAAGATDPDLITDILDTVDDLNSMNEQSSEQTAAADKFIEMFNRSKETNDSKDSDEPHKDGEMTPLGDIASMLQEFSR